MRVGALVVLTALVAATVTAAIAVADTDDLSGAQQSPNRKASAPRLVDRSGSRVGTLTPDCVLPATRRNPS